MRADGDDRHRGDDAAHDGEARKVECAIGEAVNGVCHGGSFGILYASMSSDCSMRGGNSAFSRARLMLKLESSWQRVGFSRELEMGCKLSTLPNVRFARGWSDICAKVPEGRLASDRTSGYPHGKARRASGRDADEPSSSVRRSCEKDLSSQRVKRPYRPVPARKNPSLQNYIRQL